MKHQHLIAVFFLSLSFIAHADRQAFVINNTAGNITVKGPVKVAKKIVGTSNLKPGQVAVRNVEAEGTETDILDLLVLDNDTEAVKKYQGRYPKQLTVIIVQSTDGALSLQIADAFTPARITDSQTF